MMNRRLIIMQVQTIKKGLLYYVFQMIICKILKNSNGHKVQIKQRWLKSCLSHVSTVYIIVYIHFYRLILQVLSGILNKKSTSYFALLFALYQKHEIEIKKKTLKLFLHRVKTTSTRCTSARGSNKARHSRRRFTSARLSP